MTKYIEVIHNIETGEVIERPYNADEIALHKEMEQQVLNELAVLEIAAADKTAAQAKLAALGLTANDLKALGI